MFESILVPLGWVGGGSAGAAVARPVIGPIDFSSDQAFFFLCLAILIVVGVLVILVRSGTTGQLPRRVARQ